MTFLATSPDFRTHDIPGHPETARRLESILDHLQTSPHWKRWKTLMPDREATDEELLRTHSRRAILAVHQAEQAAPAWLDPDTYVVAGSERAARQAARLTVQTAVRTLETGEPGFVLARPPGHHATRDRSMGFCLYNNVAVATQALLASHPSKKILIFDHDVHHGNGTQDIFYNSPNVLYQSFHLSPHYPGTGSAEEIGEGEGEGFTVNAPLSHGMGEEEVRAVFEKIFKPIGIEFRPDLILVSAGFDSLAGDPLGGLRLAPPFYGELIQRLRQIQPRLACVLEGGYQLEQIPQAVEHELHAFEDEEHPNGSEKMHDPPCISSLRAFLSPYWSTLKS